jgi:zinc transporter 1/2/3
MVAVFAIFIAELLAFRWGTKMLAKIGESHGKIDYDICYLSCFKPSRLALLLTMIFLIDVHGHTHGGYVAHGPEAIDRDRMQKSGTDIENIKHDSPSPREADAIKDKALSQIIGVAVLESGIALHRSTNAFFLFIPDLTFDESVLIGLALAVDPNFKIVFVVLIFHRARYILSQLLGLHV